MIVLMFVKFVFSMWKRCVGKEWGELLWRVWLIGSELVLSGMLNVFFLRSAVVVTRSVWPSEFVSVTVVVVFCSRLLIMLSILVIMLDLEI